MTQKKVDDVQKKINDFAQKMDKKEVAVAGRKLTGLQAVMFIAGIVGIIGCFLPFIEAETSLVGFSASSGASYVSIHGIISIIFVVAACVLTFLGKKLFALIPAALNFLMIIYDCFFSASIGGSAGAASVEVSLKIGAYVVLVAGIIILVMSVLGFLLERNK